MTTLNMGLTLPTVGTTTDPTWSNELNAAVTTIDAHDHSSGKGARITPAGLNISTDLPMSGHAPTGARAISFTNLASAPSDQYALFWKGGDLWANNGSGAAFQVTTGGATALNVGVISQIGWTVKNVTTSIGINASDAYSIYSFSVSSLLATLPLANSVPAGRSYFFCDNGAGSGLIVHSGSDTIGWTNSNTASFGNGQCLMLTSDGVSHWIKSGGLPSDGTAFFDVTPTGVQMVVTDIGTPETPASWTLSPGGLWVSAAASAGGLDFRVGVPASAGIPATITGVTIWTKPHSGHAAVPTPGTVALYRVGNGVYSAVVGSATDTQIATTTVYEDYHAISLTGLSEVCSSPYRYVVRWQTESGGNAVAGAFVDQVLVTLNMPPTVRLGLGCL